MSGEWPGPPPWDRRPTFSLDADVTVYWPDVRPCWEDTTPTTEALRAPESRQA